MNYKKQGSWNRLVKYDFGIPKQWLFWKKKTNCVSKGNEQYETLASMTENQKYITYPSHLQNKARESIQTHTPFSSFFHLNMKLIGERYNEKWNTNCRRKERETKTEPVLPIFIPQGARQNDKKNIKRPVQKSDNAWIEENALGWTIDEPRRRGRCWKWWLEQSCVQAQLSSRWRLEMNLEGKGRIMINGYRCDSRYFIHWCWLTLNECHWMNSLSQAVLGHKIVGTIHLLVHQGNIKNHHHVCPLLLKKK